MPTKVNLRAALPLPVPLIQESIEIDESVPSGLRWKTRPRHHFETDRIWKIRNTKDAGKPAGTRWLDTIYFAVGIGGATYKTHRVIFFLANSIDPGAYHVDHIDPSIPFPNIASNLRLATNAENMRNAGRRTNNTSGVPGVYWNKAAQKWMAYINVNYKMTNLGIFGDFEDAVAARKAAEVRCFGSFAFDASQKSTSQTTQYERIET